MPRRFLIDVQFIPLPAIVAEGYFVLSRDLKNMTEPIEDIAEYITGVLVKNYDDEGDPNWAALAPSTLERKARGGWPSDILVREGALKEEVSSMERWDINKESHGATAIFQSGPAINAYGHFHLSGTGFMPQRDFMALKEEIVDDAEDRFTKWVDVQVEKF